MTSADAPAALRLPDDRWRRAEIAFWLVAVAAFGVGLLVGHLVSRES